MGKEGGDGKVLKNFIMVNESSSLGGEYLVVVPRFTTALWEMPGNCPRFCHWHSIYECLLYIISLETIAVRVGQAKAPRRAPVKLLQYPPPMRALSPNLLRMHALAMV